MTFCKVKMERENHGSSRQQRSRLLLVAQRTCSRRLHTPESPHQQPTWIASPPLGLKGSVTDASKRKLQDFRRNIFYLIIDEHSVLSKTFLATLSQNIAIGVEGSSSLQPGQFFVGSTSSYAAIYIYSPLSPAGRGRSHTIRSVRRIPLTHR